MASRSHVAGKKAQMPRRSRAWVFVTWAFEFCELSGIV